jgi:hypothetical protein
MNMKSPSNRKNTRASKEARININRISLAKEKSVEKSSSKPHQKKRPRRRGTSLTLTYVPKEFETSATAKQRNRQLIKWLTQTNTNEAMQLAATLDDCGNPELPRCNSGACRVCLRKNRLRKLREIRPYIQLSLGSEFVTLIPIDYVVPRGKLHTVSMKEIAKRVARGLRDVLSSNLVAVGGIDISLNAFENEDHVWVIHAHIIVLNYSDGPTTEAVRSRLKERFRLPADCNKALRIENVKISGEYRVASYGLKSIFNLKSGYWIRGKCSLRLRKGQARPQRLKSEDEVELRLWLARWTAADRLILVGVTNQAGPEFIRLRDTSRTPQTASSRLVHKRPKPRVTRAQRVQSRIPR